MSTWQEVGRTVVPGGDGELRLLRRRDEYSMRTARHGELMNSRTHGSEDALGTLACSDLEAHSGTRILIGGLGMGFTLRAALGCVHETACVVVAELLEDVVRWNEGPLGACADHPLRDPRVRVVIGDVGALIANPDSPWDAITLDVDNGPEGLTRPGNDRLYSPDGLARAREALTMRGVLAVWSATPDRRFVRRLQQAGFRVDERRVRAHGGRGARHVVWLARPR